jgi:hypothetical protein
MMRSVLTKIGGAVLWVGIVASPLAAQSLGLAPAEIRATFKPQQVQQFDLNVSNEGDTPIPMRASVMDLWYDQKTNEKVFGTPGTLPHSASNWIAFVPPTFTVPAHGTGKVKVVITPPAEAAGGSYAVLFVESKPELARGGAADGKPIYANMRLGALILLTAEGTEDYRIEISEPKLTPPAGNQNLELTFTLANNSNAHIFPEARLAIMSASRQVVARTEMESRRFFPGQKDSLKVTWAGTLPPGDYTALLTISYGKNKVYTQEFPLHVADGADSPVGP